MRKTLDLVEKALPLIDQLRTVMIEKKVSFYPAMQSLLEDGALFIYMEGDIYIMVHMDMEGMCIDYMIEKGLYQPTPDISIIDDNFCAVQSLPYSALQQLPFDWKRFKFVPFDEVVTFVDEKKYDIMMRHAND